MDVQSLLSSLTEVEQQQVLKILNDLQNGDSRYLNELIGDVWDEIPVDIDTFIDNEKYMRNYCYPDGKSCLLYPYWRKELKKIFKEPYKYSEVVVTGGIGLGKSEFAKMGLCYLTYRLMCLKNPQLFYSKPQSKPIVVLFFNNNLSLAESVLLQPFIDMLLTSPWFMSRGKMLGRTHIQYKPDNKNIEFLPGSRDSHALGMDVFCGMIDEINFAAGQDVSLEKSKIMNTYNAINTRITNRFRVEGNVHGKLFIVSSKKSEYDFIEQYAQRMKDQPHFYMIDDKVWNVVPKEKTGYSGKTFNLAIGGDTLPSKIIADDESVDEYIKQGYDIMEVPIEEKSKFILDMERSLMDIAGVSVSSVTKFLNFDIISQCYGEDNNPFTQEILTIGTKDTHEIKDFFLLGNISNEIKKKPIFIHIDTSLTGDRTGIGAVALFAKQKTRAYDFQAGRDIVTVKTVYKHVFNVEIQCPKNDEISFQKTRNFILYLRQSGFHICGITTDGFQSSDTIQLLKLNGFDNVDRLNFEKTPDIYLTFRNALIEQRIKLLKLPKLEKELLLVERNNTNGKISHPANTGDGHGDGADGIAGALYNATRHEGEYSNMLTTLDMLTPADNEIGKQSLLEIAAGLTNLKNESPQSSPIPPTPPISTLTPILSSNELSQIPPTNDSIVNWIL